MENIKPPRLARRIFTWYCGNAQVDDLVGDMDEIFKNNLKRMSPIKAKAKYWLQIFSLIFSYAIKRRRQWSSFHPHSNNSINFHMIRNYFLIAWRTSTRNIIYTTINVLGLSLGISACLIVYLVVSHEFSFDRFLADKERIYRVKADDEGSENQGFFPCTPAPAFPAFRDAFIRSEALAGCHLLEAKVTIADKGEVKHFERNSVRAVLVNPEYFKIFQYEWLAGNMNALSEPMKVVVTESRAKTYFGSLAPHEILGKTITYDDSLNVVVSGVVKDWTENSDFNHWEFVSFSTIENSFLRRKIQLDNWGMFLSSSQTFIKLNEGDKPADIELELTNASRKVTTQKYRFALEPLTDVHFDKSQNGHSALLSNLYVLVALAGFILVIAAINFINLSTAQSIRRSREIGIRKVMGSMKLQIVFQFLSETLVLSLAALCLSLALVGPLLSVFEGFVPAGVTFNPFSLDNWLFVGGMLLVVSLLAGLYPALVLSSYLPAVTLSGRALSIGRQRWSFRKALIVFQFTVSLFFISATIVVSNQLDFIRKQDRGFSTASVVTFQTNWDDRVEKVEVLANQIRSMHGVEMVAVQGFNPMGFAYWSSSVNYNSKNGKVETISSVKPGDENFIPLYQMRIIAGRNIPANETSDVVINRSLVKALGFDDPNEAIGEQFESNGVHTIVGVVEDFHELSFRNPMGPCMIGRFKNAHHGIAIRLANPEVSENIALLANIESAYKNLYPNEPFKYHYIEDEIGWMHEGEQKTGKLASIAMGVTIFISCMGVFGLAMFTAAMRTREIGIRKVLGASVAGIVNLLSREFIVLIIISIALATPVAWYYMNDWLMGFTYAAPLSIWVFVSAGVIALLTGLVTVSYQAIKAAFGNPVNALKTE
ncbi:MAG TPA: ABC transporter permease [Cyclobacteriaceae bacterium]|nr:ABC transporter permease [Cyclobacteriaceae bacterium]